MSSSIVICEKGKQAQAIKRAVGSKFGQVLPAQGHILTLKEPDEVREEWAGKWRPGLLWPGRFYEKKPVPETKAKLDAIRSAARSASRIIIATDCDREGQLIGDEIVEYLGFRGEVLRCIFNAEDPKSLQQAFANLRPNSEFRGLYMSGQAREQADQTTNLSLTRTATACLKDPGSRGAIGIGRVKSPVLGIICKRELEIENFQPQDMFEVDALTSVAAGAFTLTCSKLPKSLLKEQIEDAEDEDEEELTEDQAALQEQENTSGRIMKRDIAEGLRAAVVGFKGDLRSKSEKKRQGPPKLFDLTALQSTASSKFGWTGEKTLEIAQKLYSERTLITYPRGEAKYLPENNIADIPKLVPALLRLPEFGRHQPLLQSPQVRKGKSGHFSNKALEGLSHYAIIPNVNTAESFGATVPSLTQDEAKLFDVIVRQYLAALAPDFEYRQTTIEMRFPWKGHDWDFRTSGRVPLVPGWKEILGGAGSSAKDGEQELPAINTGEKGNVESAKLRTVTTKPPARYTEGSLIKLMQEAWRLVPPGPNRERLKAAKGIGTPATRGDVVKGLIEQGQVKMKGKSFIPTEGGMRLYKSLMQACPNVVDPARTAIWETIFDLVEQGRLAAEDALEKIFQETKKEIQNITNASGSVSITIGKTVKPSPKMVAAAKAISERKKIKLPAKCTTDASVCRAFLDEHLPKRDPNAPAGQGGTYPPSEKQLALAAKLAGEAGTQVPDDVKESSKALSAWIDAAMKKAPPRPPSEKQLAFATKLAEENNVDLPAAVKKNMKDCSAFIDKMMGGAKKSSGSRRKQTA
ncbi:DNA topoisomerase [Leisingera sp. XS_AS12]|uniref:DNA topoisomerase n=1 Tax=Leisingera sp. XS_AS12 TaxID=3241294 RepID=UPI0035193857